jgi:hypothetical protein
MNNAITQPSPTVRQVSGNGPDGRPILAVLAKRTYQLAPDGRCQVAGEQVPLQEEPLVDPDMPALLACDIDLFPRKPATDLVINGHAYGHGKPRFQASVAIDERLVKAILVIGNRTCGLLKSGEVDIAPPAPVEKVPLSYTHAYGGMDQVAHAKYGNPFLDAMNEGGEPHPVDPARVSVFRYPRNPAGRGYLMEPTPEAVAALRLPNLEDPLDPLTPTRLAVGTPVKWARMPLPQATGWVNYDWFPRFHYLGMRLPTAPLERRLAEVERGFAPPNILVEPRLPSTEDAFRFTSGASLGLQLPYLKGNETIILGNMSPAKDRLSIRLPAERPRMWVDGRKGTMKETGPVILHTIVLEPDLGRLIVVWRGAAPALRPYLPQELEKMPLRVEW